MPAAKFLLILLLHLAAGATALHTEPSSIAGKCCRCIHEQADVTVCLAPALARGPHPSDGLAVTGNTSGDHRPRAVPLQTGSEVGGGPHLLSCALPACNCDALSLIAGVAGAVRQPCPLVFDWHARPLRLKAARVECPAVTTRTLSASSALPALPLGAEPVASPPRHVMGRSLLQAPTPAPAYVGGSIHAAVSVSLLNDLEEVLSLAVEVVDSATGGVISCQLLQPGNLYGGMADPNTEVMVFDRTIGGEDLTHKTLKAHVDVTDLPAGDYLVLCYDYRSCEEPMEGLTLSARARGCLELTPSPTVTVTGTDSAQDLTLDVGLGYIRAKLDFNFCSDVPCTWPGFGMQGRLVPPGRGGEIVPLAIDGAPLKIWEVSDQDGVLNLPAYTGVAYQLQLNVPFPFQLSTPPLERVVAEPGTTPDDWLLSPYIRVPLPAHLFCQPNIMVVMADMEGGLPPIPDEQPFSAYTAGMTCSWMIVPGGEILGEGAAANVTSIELEIDTAAILGGARITVYDRLNTPQAEISGSSLGPFRITVPGRGARLVFHSDINAQTGLGFTFSYTALHEDSESSPMSTTTLIIVAALVLIFTLLSCAAVRLYRSRARAHREAAVVEAAEEAAAVQEHREARRQRRRSRRGGTRLPAELMARLTVVEYAPAPHSGAGDVEAEGASSSTVCCVCLDDFAVGQMVTWLPCGHPFHQECVVPWLSTRASCPVCKDDVKKSLIKTMAVARGIDINFGELHVAGEEKADGGAESPTGDEGIPLAQVAATWPDARPEDSSPQRHTEPRAPHEG